MPIELCDLGAEHAPLRADLESAFRRVLSSSCFVLGPEVATFEREVAEVLGVPYAVGTSSGTDALLAILTACGVRPGDEVVTSPFSFFATVESILRLGARPVFADVCPETLNLNPLEALGKVGPRTRAILVVHLYGRPANIAPLVESCRNSAIKVVEDAAQAMGAGHRQGATWIPVGSTTAGATLSFHPSKNLGGFGDGGMVITTEREIAASVRALRVHGASEKFRHQSVGGNFRLDELQAALLRVKLPHLVRFNERRRMIAAAYIEGLQGLELVLPTLETGHVWSRFVLRVPRERREALAGHLAESGIATAVYYPQPLHLQPALAKMGYTYGPLPNAERAAAEVLALPIHPMLSSATVERICEQVRRFFRG